MVRVFNFVANPAETVALPGGVVERKAERIQRPATELAPPSAGQAVLDSPRKRWGK
jgi:hypothetical protein